METLDQEKAGKPAVGDCWCCRRPKSGWEDRRSLNRRADEMPIRIGPSASGGADNAISR
jgi:hypothetical protein